MIISEYILSALQSIRSNKLRAGLSMLGIIIGVFSIIVMLAIGEGTSSSVVGRLSSMGANLLTISPGGSNQSNVRSSGWSSARTSILTDDLLAYIATIPGIKNVSPTVSGSRQFIYQTYNTNTQIIGVRPIYQELKNLVLANGVFISDDQIQNVDTVIVLGNTLANNAFGKDDPIGKEIKLQNTIFTVIGVLTDNSQFNNRALIPVSTAMAKITGTHYYSSVDIQVNNPDYVTTMQTFLEQELNRYLGIRNQSDEPYTINTMAEILASLEQVTATMTFFLGGIAAISLIVWGIGVMNIMLVSVTERTREIGIRKALGATSDDIMYQFLSESLLVSLLAWGIGIWGSFLTVQIINRFTTAIVTTSSVLIAFGSVVFIGIVFGLLPASKAAKLHPIDALRFE